MTDLIETVARGMAEDANLDPDIWTVYRHEARASLRAIEAAGYRIVPVEATKAMRGAYHDAREEAENGDIYPEGTPDYEWKAMLAAAPKVVP